MDCRKPQRYATAPGQHCWHHDWVHLDGTGVAAMAEWLIPEGKLTPITLTDQKVEEQFKTIFAELESGTVDSMLQVSLALHQLLTLCAQGLLNQEQTESNQQVIQQAAQTIREKYNQPLSLNDLLRQAHMSRSYFLRLFRRYMGTTPYNYLISTRITQAKALLALTQRVRNRAGSWFRGCEQFFRAIFRRRRAKSDAVPEECAASGGKRTGMIQTCLQISICYT